jgi:hypothetical protein
MHLLLVAALRSPRSINPNLNRLSSDERYIPQLLLVAAVMLQAHLPSDSKDHQPAVAQSWRW